MSEKSDKHSTSSGLSEALKVGIEVIIALGAKDYLKPSIEYLNKTEAVKVPFMLLLVGSMGIIFYVGFGSLKWFGERLDRVSRPIEAPFEIIKFIIEFIYIIFVIQITFIGEKLANALLIEKNISLHVKLIADSATNMGKFILFIEIAWLLWRFLHLIELHYAKIEVIDEHDREKVTLSLMGGYILFALLWFSYWRYGLYSSHFSRTLSTKVDNINIGIILGFFILLSITISYKIYVLRNYYFPQLFTKKEIPNDS
jgi:hypothetical protein